MHKIAYKPYVLLALFLVCSLYFSENAAESIRSKIVSGFSPMWRACHKVHDSSLFLLNIPIKTDHSSDSKMHSEIDRLSQENQALQAQMEAVRDYLLNEERVQTMFEKFQNLKGASIQESEWKNFFKIRSAELSRLLELQILSLPAQVIFREPSSWTSQLWINIGEEDNIRLNKTIIGKNSPVLSGSSLVGVVEQVDKKQSRVRLITDSRLKPSVRTARGKIQNHALIEHVEALLLACNVREDLFSQNETKQRIIQDLHLLKTNLLKEAGQSYLAKGQIQGSSAPLWRSRGQILKGIGFNYDFADQEGFSRDLRTGTEYRALLQSKTPIAILNPGDLLVTTGMDGVFPAGLRVATVTKIQKLKEGDSSYEIEAVPTAGNLDELNHLLVLPPITSK